MSIKEFLQELNITIGSITGNEFSIDNYILAFLFLILTSLIIPAIQRSLRTRRGKKNLRRMIIADIHLMQHDFNKMPEIRASIGLAEENESYHPWFIFDGTRMSNYFHEFNQEAYLLPTLLAKDIFQYFGGLDHCKFLCDQFSTERFTSFDKKRRVNAYNIWYKELETVQQCSESLLVKLETPYFIVIIDWAVKGIWKFIKAPHRQVIEYYQQKSC